MMRCFNLFVLIFSYSFSYQLSQWGAERNLRRLLFVQLYKISSFIFNYKLKLKIKIFFCNKKYFDWRSILYALLIFGQALHVDPPVDVSKVYGTRIAQKKQLLCKPTKGAKILNKNREEKCWLLSGKLSPPKSGKWKVKIWSLLFASLLVSFDK